LLVSGALGCKKSYGPDVVATVNGQPFQRPEVEKLFIDNKEQPSKEQAEATRLGILKSLIPEVAEAFQEERITASHANPIARLPQDSQKGAFTQCWRKDGQDNEPHLLPANYLSA
jgi:hypothetical protein